MDKRSKKPRSLQEFLARRKNPAPSAMKLHPFYRGKIETGPQRVHPLTG